MYSQLRTNKDGFLCTWRTSCIAPYRWLKYNLHNNITLVHWDEKIMHNANWFWKLPLKVFHVKASFMFHGPVHAEISMSCIWICNISFLNSKHSFKACLLHASNQILHGICIHIRKWWRLFFPWWWWDSDKQSIGMNKKWSDDTKLRLIFRLSKYWHT